MSFNFLNSAGIQNLFNSRYFITRSFLRYVHMYSAAYEMESCVRGYHVYKDLQDTSIGEDKGSHLMMQIDMLWLYSKMTPLLAIFKERYLRSVLCF